MYVPNVIQEATYPVYGMRSATEKGFVLRRQLLIGFTTLLFIPLLISKASKKIGFGWNTLNFGRNFQLTVGHL